MIVTRLVKEVSPKIFCVLGLRSAHPQIDVKDRRESRTTFKCWLIIGGDFSVIRSRLFDIFMFYWKRVGIISFSRRFSFSFRLFIYQNPRKLDFF